MLMVYSRGFWVGTIYMTPKTRYKRFGTSLGTAWFLTLHSLVWRIQEFSVFSRNYHPHSLFCTSRLGLFSWSLCYVVWWKQLCLVLTWVTVSLIHSEPSARGKPDTPDTVLCFFTMSHARFELDKLVGVFPLLSRFAFVANKTNYGKSRLKFALKLITEKGRLWCAVFICGSLRDSRSMGSMAWCQNMGINWVHFRTCQKCSWNSAILTTCGLQCRLYTLTDVTAE